MAQFFTRVTEEGIGNEFFFGACKRKFSQILKKIKISIVTVIAETLPRGLLQLLQITVITDNS